MSNLQHIKLRIRGIQSTRKITKSMKMVAASRMQRAQRQALATRPYTEELSRLFFQLIGNEQGFHHPLATTRHDVTKITYFVFTSDRGLCGSFNNALLRQTLALVKEKVAAGYEVEIIPIGRKGVQFFKWRGYSVPSAFTQLPTHPTFQLAEKIMQTGMAAFLEAKTDEVWFIYNHFVSTLVHEPVAKKLLPIEPASLLTTTPLRTGLPHTQAVEIAPPTFIEPLFEPDRNTVLNQVLPQYLNAVVLQAFFESYAGEHSARMAAMDQATRNAENMIQEQTLLYNKARQASITKEILEVVGGAEALTKG